ncbi:hypothetical protein CEUSTIGMA_g8065.t1 [Chlamydomonas eustigma]|uniref:Amidase domain-containing protein n=1 Tax=Chlamydomonas eustigma TaxID=1157962 RepID=A0A250XCZ9_9CHLO|nr:hypothetical protein CEUSTIGMA_g8065.t1 [Chlamydomonas eustigma]|eukprot:GAX80630.1 hypothetical protein CEUSTIGMA_g8065.t1 [Chlamydomonas eustigma]
MSTPQQPSSSIPEFNMNAMRIEGEAEESDVLAAAAGATQILAEAGKSDVEHPETEIISSQENTNDAAGLHDSHRSPLPPKSPQPDPKPANQALIPSPITAHQSMQNKGSKIMPLLLTAAALAGVAFLSLLRRQRSSPQEVQEGGSLQGVKKNKAASKKQGNIVKQETSQVEGGFDFQAPEEPEAAPDGMEALLQVPAVLLPPEASAIPVGLTLPMVGFSFVVSEDIDVAGAATTLGVPGWRTLHPPADTSASAVQRLVSAGATCLGKTSIQPLGLDMMGQNMGGPLNRSRVAGGANSGAAVAVGTGQADLALTTDTLGEARVPAACCGLYCFRPSPGVLGRASSTSTTTSLQGLAVMARDSKALMKSADVLGVPGSNDLRGEIIKFVVAQDLFDLCAPELQPATVALKKAILKWAGADQAGAVQLVRYLSTNTGAWQAIKVPEPSSTEEGGQPIRLGGFVEAAVEAARTLRLEELHSALAAAPHLKHLLPASSPLQAEAAAAAAAPAALDQEVQVNGATEKAGQVEDANESAGSPAEDSGDATSGAANHCQEQGDVGATTSNGDNSMLSKASETVTGHEDPKASDEGGTPAAAAAAAAAVTPMPQPMTALDGTPLPPRPTKEAVEAASALMKEVSEVLKQTVKPDTIMVLPGLPFPPPKRTADKVEQEVFEKLVQCFNSVTSLGGCPSVTCPVGSLRDGSPISISLFAVQRFDKRLLAVAQKLTPMIQDSFLAVKEEITQMAIAEAQGKNPAAPSVPNVVPTSNGKAVPNGHAPHAAAPAPIDPKKAEKAEKFKAKGNEMYSAGRHAEAVTEYTKAINTNPQNAVYFNNRAMACIKLFRFEQAEDDCCKALQFPDLSEKDKVKALLRRATARDALQKYDEAEKDLREVLGLEPGNRQAREDLQNLRAHKAEMAAQQAAMAKAIRSRQAAGGQGRGNGMPLAGAGGFDSSQLPSNFQLPPGFDPALLGDLQYQN